MSNPGKLVLENYIGGKFVPCSKHIDSYDPATGAVYCRVPDSGAEEELGSPPVRKARSIKTWMSELAVEELDYPAQSPDLNLTEPLG
ncbi:hypothetical protein NFI96_015472 [Prochilodus magdalenae]|nr:hypothetical protein NFI96_015472 [Prochilodus magdalenae]